MASGAFSQFQYSRDKGRTWVTGVVDVGAAGAAVLQKWTASSSGPGSYGTAPSTGWSGVASITKNATAGNYTITLTDNFNRLLGFEVRFSATAGLPLAPIVGMDSSATLSTVLLGGNNLTFQCSASTGAATNPDSTEIMYVTLCLQNSVAV